MAPPPLKRTGGAASKGQKRKRGNSDELQREEGVDVVFSFHTSHGLSDISTINIDPPPSATEEETEGYKKSVRNYSSVAAKAGVHYTNYDLRNVKACLTRVEESLS